MDELDKKLYHDLTLDIEVPNKCETIIREGLNMKTKHYSITKLTTTACAIFFLTIGIVYAGTSISDKIWKTPEKVVGFSSAENTIKENPNEQVMTEEEARKKAEEILKKFERKDEKISSIKLTNNQANYDLTWDINTDRNTNISFSANDESSFNLSVDTILYKDIKKYRTTEKEAEKTAKNLCNKYGYDLNEYNHVQISSNMNSENESYIWYVHFYKKYDGIINPFERIDVSFIPEINEIYQFSVTNVKFENNPIEITEEKAKEIALKEEEKINTKYKMKDISVHLDIIQMNSLAYFRINDYEQFQRQSFANYPSEKHVDYRTDNRIRKVWVVTINYDIPTSVNKFDGSYNMNDEKFSYYIDATTGEIIGGSCIYEINNNN